MKKTNFLFAGILALSLLASCKNEEMKGGGSDNPGEEAIATFRIRIGGSTAARTAASSRAIATAEESRLTRLDLLVFDNAASADVSKPADGATLEAISKVNLPENGGAATAKIVTEQGKKIVVAVANNNPEGKAHFTYNNGMTWETFKKLAAEAASVSEGGTKIDFNLAPEVDGFLMVSDPKYMNVTADGNNTADLSLNRLSAKVQVAVATPLGTGTEFPAGVGVTFSNPLYLPFQYQTKVYPVVPAMSDGNNNVGNEVPRTVTNYVGGNEPDFTMFYEPGTYTLPTGEKPEGTEPEWANAKDNKVYVSENIMALAKPKRNYITSLLVKLDFADIDYSDDDTGTGTGINVVYQFKTEADAIAKNANAVIAMKGVYKDPVKADEVAEAAGADHAVVSFAKPTGYYRVDLTNRNVGTLPQAYSVLRNTYYQVKLTSVNSFGWPTPDDVTDPDDGGEVGEDVIEIAAEVDIVDWVTIGQEQEL